MFVYNNIDERKFLKLFTKLVDEKQLEIMDRDKITKTTKKLSLKTTEIIDNYGILDSHLNKFCLSTGFCSSEDTVSLKEEVDTFDNDYSEYEKLYYEEFGTELLGKTSINKTYLYKPVSIVIPCFNSEATIIQTIASIQSQNVPKNLLRKTEVILVDDGSNIPIENVLKKYGGKIYTQVKIVRLNRNSGPSTARNIGADVAKQKIILFIDSDILLPSNYLMEISIRNIFIPTAVFVTFKQNIEKDNEKISLKNIQKGLAVPNPSLDMRITKKIDQNVPGVYAINREKYIEILSETDCFKQFGYGRKVGIFDLPAMVVSHNVSTRRKNFFRAGGFSNEFIGWGMEDSFFGARMIARRNFIIPILSTGVYHIDHLPRSGSEEEKEKEFKINLAKYKKLMMDTLDED